MLFYNESCLTLQLLTGSFLAGYPIHYPMLLRGRNFRKVTYGKKIDF